MWAWLGLLLLAVPAEGDDSKVILNADHVWCRKYHDGPENPVIITIDNPGKAIQGSLLLQWGVGELYQSKRNVGSRTLEGAAGPIYEMPVTIPEKTKRRYFAYVKGQPPSNVHQLWVFLKSGQKDVARFAVMGASFKNKEAVIGQVGTGQVPGLNAAGLQVAECRAEELPDRWFGFNGLSALLWLDADAATVGDPAQVDALKQWIAAGGHLIVARSHTVGLAGTFLEEILPVSTKGPRRHADWTPLGDWIGSKRAPAPEEGALLEVERRRGTILAISKGTPLIVQSRFGRGRITFLPFNPMEGAFLKWPQADAFWKRLLDLPEPVSQDEVSANRRRYYSTSDLGAALGSSELERLMGVHPGVNPPSLGWAFSMICVYVILVGPFDYLVLRRLKRMEWTWVTFPAYVLLFSAIALVAGAKMSYRPVLSRETVVLDGLPDQELVRGWSIASLLTPSEERFDVTSIKNPSALNPFFTVSQGYYGESGAGLRIEEGRVSDWFFPRGATGVMIAKWVEKALPLRVEFEDVDTIKITNTTGAPIEEAFFIKGGEGYSLGRIPQGDSRHALGRPMGDWRKVTERLGVTRVPSERDRNPDDYEFYEYSHMYPGIEDSELRTRIRASMIQASFARAMVRPRFQSDKGVAAELDASSWVEGGGSLFLGWTEGTSVLQWEGVSLPRTADTLLRVFVRHDQN